MEFTKSCSEPQREPAGRRGEPAALRPKALGAAAGAVPAPPSARRRSRRLATLACALAAGATLPGCLMSHSVRSARTTPEGRLAMQLDGRLQARLGREGGEVKDSLVTKAAIDTGTDLLFGGASADMWLEYGATERLSASVLLGLGTATLAADLKLALVATPAFALSFAAGYWGYPLGDGVHGYRVCLLTATQLGGNVDLLLNGHLARSLGSRLDMVGGAIGVDLPRLAVVGLRPMVDYSSVPAGGATTHVLTLVVAVTYP